MWLCPACRAGAATLPVLKKAAPRDLVNRIWQAALDGGRTSELACPSCLRPFSSLVGSRAAGELALHVCTRCHRVWLGPDSLARFSELREPAETRRRIEQLAAAHAQREADLAVAEAHESLAWLAALEVLSGLP